MVLKFTDNELWLQPTVFNSPVQAPLAPVTDITIWHRTTEQLNKTRNVHDFNCLYVCLAGKGKIEIDGIAFTVNAGEALGVLPTQPHLRLPSISGNTTYLLIRFKSPVQKLIQPAFNRVITLPGKMTKLLQKIVCSYEKSCRTHEPMHSNSCGLYIGELLNFMRFDRSLNEHMPARNDSRLEEAIRLLIAPDNTALPINVIAKKVGVTPGHLSDMLRDKLGCSPSALRAGRRINIARDYLVHTDLSISQIAELAGFKSVYSFSRFFAKHTNGLSPSMFRKQSAAK